MRLQTQAPLRMLETITDREPSILIALRTVHGLQEEVLKVEVLETFRLGARLREDQLQFVAGTKDKIASGLRADADPVDATWSGKRRCSTPGSCFCRRRLRRCSCRRRATETIGR